MQTKTTTELPGGLVPLLKQRELEEYFRVSHWTVAQWLEAGCPVRRTPSGHKRYDLAAVLAWMDEQQPAAQSA